MDDGELLQCKDDLTKLVSDDARALYTLQNSLVRQACRYYCEKSEQVASGDMFEFEDRLFAPHRHAFTGVTVHPTDDKTMKQILESLTQ